jgi:hypothetical protein
MAEARIFPTTMRISMGNENVKDLIAAFVNAARTHIDPVRPGFTDKFMSPEKVDALVEEVTLKLHKTRLQAMPSLAEILAK